MVIFWAKTVVFKLNMVVFWANTVVFWANTANTGALSNFYCAVVQSQILPMGAAITMHAWL